MTPICSGDGRHNPGLTDGSSHVHGMEVDDLGTGTEYAPPPSSDQR